MLTFSISPDLADDVSRSTQRQCFSFVISITPNSCDDAASYGLAVPSITSSTAHASSIANESLLPSLRCSFMHAIFL